MKHDGENMPQKTEDLNIFKDHDSSPLNTLPFALLVVDKKGDIIECNSICLTLFAKTSPESINGFPLANLLFLGAGEEPSENIADLFPVEKNITVFGKIRDGDREGITVRIMLFPLGGDAKKTLVQVMAEGAGELSPKKGLHQAYLDQKILNHNLGEILELSRTFSLYLNLERVMNQIVRVVSESLGYGLVGLYLKDEKSDRMRVATYSDTSVYVDPMEIPNPGIDWDDAYRAGEKENKVGISGKNEIWRIDDNLLALVRLEGSIASGFIRVSKPLGKLRTGTLIRNAPLDMDMFRQQALWIFANQAAISIENAILFEKAQVEINDRKQAENELASAQEELKKRIHTRTLRLEKANLDLQEEIRKREITQIALDGQQEFLRQVLDTNPTLIYVRDRTGRYTLVNEAAAKFEGLTVEDINGKMVNDLNHDMSQIMRWRHEDLDVLDNHREIVLIEERVRDSHGSEHYFQTIKRPITSLSGEPDLVLGVSVDITALKRAEERTLQANVDLANAYDATIEGWSRALDYRDQDTEGHSNRVTTMTLKLADAMGIERAEHQTLRRGALLHDIGKMGIPDRILRKQGPLSPSEWEIMRKHPVIAYTMLNPIEYLSKSLVIPHYHHEKWDGNGYPEGLAGEMIPLGARIFAVVDVWDALSTDRPYRKAWGRESVLDYIKTNSGSHFDPNVVKVFIENLDKILSKNQN
jgi:PAS domain S-box-containing protein/putative nucleotidyltransferase with HDIG domain